MIGVLISVYDKEIYEIVLDDEKPFKDAYVAMFCDTIEVVRNAKIGNRNYDILVDEAGLMKDNLIPSARTEDDKQTLFGSIIILNADDESGEFYSLDKKDLFNIKENIFTLTHKKTKEKYPCLLYSFGKGDDYEDFDTNGLA